MASLLSGQSGEWRSARTTGPGEPQPRHISSCRHCPAARL